MAKQTKDFSRMFMGVARADAGLRVDPTTGEAKSGIDWSKITNPITEATTEAKKNYDAKIKEQANKFDRDQIDLSKVPTAMQDEIQKWTLEMGQEYDKWNAQHAQYVNRAGNNCPTNPEEGTDCWYLHQSIEGMNNVKTAFETLNSQKDQFLTWREDFMKKNPNLSDGNEKNIVFMHNALADSDFSYFNEKQGGLNINDDGSLSFDFTLDGQEGSINFSDFAGKESLLFSNRESAYTKFQVGENELISLARGGSLYNEEVADKAHKKEYPGYHDGDKENDHEFSTAWKNIDLYVNTFYEGLTEDDFTVMIFDGNKDWDNDGKPGIGSSNAQLIDVITHLDSVVENLRKAGFKLPEEPSSGYSQDQKNEIYKDAMRAGYYWDTKGNIIDTRRGGDFRESSMYHHLVHHTTKYWQELVEQNFNADGGKTSSSTTVAPGGLPTNW